MDEQIKKDLKDVLDYVIGEMFDRLDSETYYDYEITENHVEYVMDSRSMDYYEMSHMSATDDLMESLRYHMKHLPHSLEGKVDGISGEIGEKGYFTVYTYKRID